MSLARRVDRSCALLAGAGALVAGLSLIDGDRFIAQLQAAGPITALFGLIVVLVAVLRRRPWTALVAATSCAVLLAPVVSLPTPSAQEGERTLSVLAANTYVGEADPDALLAEVAARDVDVLVMPEMSDGFWLALERGGLREYLPHVTGRTGGGRGMIVATREPAECAELPDGITCGRVVFDDHRRVVRSLTDPPSFDQLVLTLADGTTLKGVHLWTPRLSPSHRWREQQRETAEWIAAQPDDVPLVLAGDFNAGPSHPAFRAYAGEFDDTPAEFPWTRTWPKWGPIGPFTQIDHVLARGWSSVESESFALPGSDHRAVWTLLTR